MLLIAAATNFEINPLSQLLGQRENICFLQTGVGLVETTLSLTKFLSASKSQSITKVINFGVGGAFKCSGANLLDICIAQNERIADLGVCYGDSVEGFDSLDIPTFWESDPEMLNETVLHMKRRRKSFHVGAFLTVNSVTATDSRALFFEDRYTPLCENMEGAAVMRVCREYNLPSLEIRCVSNLVEQRNRDNWKLEEAAYQCAQVVSELVDLYP